MLEINNINAAFKLFRANPTLQARLNIIDAICHGAKNQNEEALAFKVLPIVVNIKNGPTVVHKALVDAFKEFQKKRGLSVLLGGGNTQ